jgi:hypothetical protein
MARIADGMIKHNTYTHTYMHLNIARSLLLDDHHSNIYLWNLSTVIVSSITDCCTSIPVGKMIQ